MADFITDTFTGSAGTAITSHTGETGATWTHNTAAYASSNMVLTDANRLRNNYSGVSLPYASGLPGDPNYSVSAAIYQAGTPPTSFLGVAGRINTAAGTFYYAVYNITGTKWQLSKNVNGSSTTLGQVSTALVNGDVVTLDMQDRMIRLLVNGVELIRAADESITAAGRAGVVGNASATNANGYHLDSFSANTEADLKLGFIGDSRTNGALHTYRPGTLAAMLIADTDRLGTCEATIHGVAGSYSGQWTSGSTNLNNAKAKFSAAGVTHVVVCLGTNDCRDDVVTSNGTFTSNMTSLIGDLTTAGYTVILVDSPGFALDVHPDFGIAALNRLRAYSPLLDALANGSTILRGDSSSLEYFADVANVSLLNADGIHLTDPGADIWADMLADSVLNLLDPLPAIPGRNRLSLSLALGL